eukprot:1158096-Pelagomonas_calceolata.AAC.6
MAVAYLVAAPCLEHERCHHSASHHVNAAQCITSQCIISHYMTSQCVRIWGDSFGAKNEPISILYTYILHR